MRFPQITRHCESLPSGVGFALAAGYFIFVSRHYAGTVDVNRDNQGYY
jgi:hypothetical protein